MSRSGFNKKQKDGGAGLAGGGDNATRAFNSGESYSGGAGGGAQVFTATQFLLLTTICPMDRAQL